MNNLKEKECKILVIYYSLEGFTKTIALEISKVLNADLCAIEPVHEIDKGMTKYVWGGGQVVMKVQPKLRSIVVDLNQYDLIFLGSPIWAGTFAPPIRTLLNQGHLNNKDICYFYTHEGGCKNAESRARKSIEKTNRWVSAFGILNDLEQLDKVKKQVAQWAIQQKNKR